MYHDDLHGPSITLHYYARRVLGFFVGAAAAVGAIALTLAALGPAGFVGAWSALTVPAELKSAVFLSTYPESTELYRIEGWRFVKASDSSVRRTAVVGNASNPVALTQPDPDRIVLERNGTPGIGLPRGAHALAAAPDGDIYAFAALAADAESAPGRASETDPSVWEIHLLNPGAIYPAGPGFAPFFIDETHLGRITPDGIMSLDLPTGQYTQLLRREFPKTVTQVVQSDDRSLIAFHDPATAKIRVYRITGDTLSEVTSITSLSGNLVRTDSEAVYELRPSAAGAEVWKHSLEGGASTMIHRFPKELRITRISL